MNHSGCQMPLFQKSVVNKYLSNLDNKTTEEHYQKYLDVYGNSERIQNIIASKEEQYQEGFLRDIFVKVLGYTINPDPSYNLTTEFKNLDDAKKADGAILSNGSAVGVIELKSTKTKNLEDIKTQAFNYKNHQPGCKYVITSNFEKIWFYIEDATEHEEFNLFDMNRQEFELFFLFLSKNSVLSDVPLRMKQDSKLHEENISKKLYKDYSSFKRKIFDNLVENNPEIDKLTLLQKSQKILDRLLFIFFAEDKGLVPPNIISKIIEDYNQLKELDAYQPLFNIYKKYFKYIDEGFKGPRVTISGYNGELFKPDPILESLVIDDEILLQDTLKLSAYDFDTEVDVNILGHIFEHSLNEIEELQAELRGEEFKAQTSKRKKDGVYYTPKYITKYIVDNTLGKLCTEKKEELGLVELELDQSLQYRSDKKMSSELQDLLDRLLTYREYLLSLKICDPACGSGAFLNQALDYLIKEHTFIDENRRIIEKDAMGFYDINNSILENNLYGVDINEEAVEIAKLSLWLRTASHGRKLSSLNTKIKCGNSLIDDPEVAGDKAFNWEKEFPEVFPKKELKAFHVTWPTYNSRLSERMIRHINIINKARMNKGLQPLAESTGWYFDEQMEIELTKQIAKMVRENEYGVLAYNICGDHVHILLVCEDNELNEIVRKLKGRTSYEMRKWLNIEKDEEFHLWAQKFNKSFIDGEDQLGNTIEYINNNRTKHSLPDSKGLKPLVQGMLTPLELAFAPQYTGGFDVVIGNPPYGADMVPKNQLDFLKNKYTVLKGKGDFYKFFIELSIQITKNKIGLITPNTWLTLDTYYPLRKLVLENSSFYDLIDTKIVFESLWVNTVIFLLDKNLSIKNIEVKLLSKSKNVNERLLQLGNKKWEASYSVSNDTYRSNHNYQIDYLVTDEIRCIKSKVTSKENQLFIILPKIRTPN
jgi:REP element-mobilizing transposase RayT